jgi:hypothetical protein
MAQAVISAGTSPSGGMVSRPDGAAGNEGFIMADMFVILASGAGNHADGFAAAQYASAGATLEQ